MLLKETALVQLLGITKIPLLAFVAPRVQQLDDDGCTVKIPLGYRTKNHLGSMYFGVLAAGADITGGLNAFLAIRQKYPRVSLVFKDFQANFLKRADGDVHFRCNDGRAIHAAMAETVRTGERVTIPVAVTATVPSKYGSEPVAEFKLGLSLKNK